ncbi:MAG: hypothetical protein FD189_884 [Elusimicrobia bacterium]|nr:MAG: hypothetical protein FD154_963 [Elusimicrobiota bacterium]KAF0156744.1 MAG: hypothetical protein FD189_884 [Elusimicrobiota bacterium]
MGHRYAVILFLGLFTALSSFAGGEEPERSSRLFDGAGTYAGATASPSAGAMDAETLKAELKKRITFDDHGSARERAGYEALLSRLLESPTARAEAEKFIQADLRIAFAFEEMDGTTIATVEGRKTVWGPRGVTYTSRVPPGVALNKAFLDHEQDVGVGTFAHETFGHAVSASSLSGDDAAANRYIVTEEENARLIGWLVRTELSVPPEDETWNYVANPEGSMRGLAMAHPYYSLQLTTDELRDPLSVYRERLVQAEELLASIPGRERNIEKWGRIVDHFINAHKMDQSSFRNIRDSLENSRKALPNTRKTYTDIRDILAQRIAYFSSEKGRAALELLRKSADAPFVAERDAAILANRQKLKDLLAGKTPESTRPPPMAGQVTWDQLRELLQADQKHCEFGGVK